MGLWLIRATMMLLFTAATWLLQPFNLEAVHAFILGLVLSILILAAELAIRHKSLKTLAGAAIGSVLGILAACLVSYVIRNLAVLSPETATFLQLFALAAFGYVGLLVGIAKGDLINVGFGGLLKERPPAKQAKILDTSVIIDGRIADILETGFLEGPLLLSHFVLRELQMIADSSESLKRNRGRRGLEVLERIQKNSDVKVQIIDQDFPGVREVDLKLIELAKETGAKILTNDFNLNKVAQLHGVEVLNINELANCLKPVVLPGEIMKVFVLKEGKEYNQGVAYLDDGTMVVVDNARRMIGKTVEVIVTSVLQTTAGKMIFGKYHPSTDVEQNSEYERERVTRL